MSFVDAIYRSAAAAFELTKVNFVRNADTVKTAAIAGIRFAAAPIVYLGHKISGNISPVSRETVLLSLLFWTIIAGLALYASAQFESPRRPRRNGYQEAMHGLGGYWDRLREQRIAQQPNRVQQNPVEFKPEESEALRLYSEHPLPNLELSEISMLLGSVERSGESRIEALREYLAMRLTKPEQEELQPYLQDNVFKTYLEERIRDLDQVKEGEETGNPFECPLSLEMYTDPVQLPSADVRCKYVCNRNQVQNLGNKHPTTREEFDVENVIPRRDILAKVERWQYNNLITWKAEVEEAKRVAAMFSDN